MTDRLGRRDHAALVGLADDALAGAACRRAEARVRALPDGERRLERQRRVVRALSAGAEPAPLPVAGSAARPRPALRLVVAGALAAAIALVLVLVPRSDDPTAQRAADIAQLPATGPAPRSSGSLLRAEVGGVRFPEWGPKFGWHATGMRRDELAGRRTSTVFYGHMGHRLGYTIVSGPPLPRPVGARIIERNGLTMSVYHDPHHTGHVVAVFERGGRTCVIAGHVIHLSTLLKLAAWKGGGQIRA